jgi:hypothetical protein
VNSFLPKRVLDLDFEFLEALPVEDRFPALLELSDSGRASWLETALILDAGDNPALLEMLWLDEAGQPGLQSPLGAGHLDARPSELRERYWNLAVPEFIKHDRRRASDYRTALLVLRRYHDELYQAGFDPYADGSFSNLLKVQKAIDTKGYSPEVFTAAATMKTHIFAAYASGADMPEESPSTLKEYLDALNRRYHGSRS